MKSIPHVSGRWPVRMLLAGLVIGLAHPLASAGEESATTDKPTAAEKEKLEKERAKAKRARERKARREK